VTDDETSRSMMEPVPVDERIDIAVVGAGPCGLAVGVAAMRAGLEAVLFDRGCLVQSVVEYPIYMTFFSTPERLEIGGIPFVVADAKPTRREALAYYRAVARRHGLAVRQYEEVVDISGRRGDFTVVTRDRRGELRRWSARAVVIATGALHEPNPLDVPGEEPPRVQHAFREAHPYADQDVVVVGGGSSAVETALELYRAGARVTVIHFEDRFDPGVKPWVLPDITNRISAGDIAVRWRSRVTEVRPRELEIRHEDTGERSVLANDWVFAMTGWRPDHRLLRALGADIDTATGIPRHDPATMETSVPGVYVAGVITAGYDANKVFIENGRHHGDLIVAGVAGPARTPRS